MTKETTSEALALRAEVENFLYDEAARLDRRDFQGWLELFTDDCIYWVPSMRDEIDPSRQVSIVYDNKQTLGERVWRLDSGLAYAQEPQSRTVHVVGSVRIMDVADAEIEVESTQVVAEFRRGSQHMHAFRCEHRLRREEAGLRIARKKVLLVNNDGHLGNLSVIL